MRYLFPHDEYTCMDLIGRRKNTGLLKKLELKTLKPSKQERLEEEHWLISQK
ncbi:hypothetical protein HanXRQr2_Chr15g0676291 [Helianthus annuus]|uniref:Uncharacterized protein n=1 Tax=Helianthus annuus TaxID=4232 RepID=A0A251S5P5_HELAN|nr:hypothetical protein HanXRQr2_Chr15g0676291 [Helianthus annuus]